MSEEKNTTEMNEAILSERKSLEYKADDADLITAINSAVSEAKSLKSIVDKIGVKNELYWRKGTDLDLKDIHPKHSKTIDNRIFMSVETIIPMLTSRTPEPSIVGNIDNDTREKLVKVLTIAYEVKQKLQLKLQSIIRHWFIYRIGVWKYRWDEKGGFTTETVRPSKIGIDPRATEKGNCEFMYERMEDTLEKLIIKFPKKKKDILAQYGADRMKSKMGYLEFWGNSGEWVVWKIGTIILGKQKNPNFDYKNEENNLFKEPQFPYLLLNVFNLGKNLYDDTSLIEQAIPLQDAVNKRKNQISDLIDEQKKLVIASSKAITQERLQEFIDKHGMLGVWLDNGEISDIKIEGGSVDASMINDLAQSIGEIDNIMGTHSTTRGERGQQETLGGRKLLTGADYGRTETIVLRVEQLMEDWFNAFLHMTKVYSMEDNEFSDGEETIILDKSEIPSGTLVMVKKGSTLPVDKAARAEMAVKLAQFNFIDPSTLFEELGYGKVDDRTQQLYDWLMKTGKIQPQQPQQPQGQPAQQGGGQQLAKLKQLISSPQFKKLSKAKQRPIIAQARAIVDKVKQGK